MQTYRPFIRILFGLAVTVAVLVAALGVRGQRGSSPPVYFFDDMKFQPKYTTQGSSPYFSDGRASRGDRGGITTPARSIDQRVAFAGSDWASDAGLLVRPDPRFLAGDLAYDRGLASRDEKPELGPDGNPTGRMVPDWLPTIPLETFLKVKNRVLPHGERERLGKLVPEERDTAIRLALVRHGRDKYSITCLACHGATGGKWGEPNANGITTLYGMNGVANYHQNRLREMPDGEIYNTITYGKNTMMGYGHMLRVEDRWAVVAYVRALQRAMLGAVEDVPENLQAELK